MLPFIYLKRRNTMKKNFKFILSVVAVMAVLLTVCVPAFAADTVTGTTANFNKYLTMKESANVPKVSFNYTISTVAPNSAYSAYGDDIKVLETRNATSGAVETPRVYSTSALTGTPTITSTVSFAPGDTTYSSVQTGDTVTLASGYKYAKKTISLDFTAVTFTKPGIYRYKISEVNTTNDGITNDTELVRYCDVYVNQKSGATSQDLEVQGYCIHKSENSIPEKGYTDWNDYGAAISAGELKDNGFENKYTTYDLVVKKEIKGNHGWLKNYFDFTVEIDGVLPNSRYDLDLTNATNAFNISALSGIKSRTEGAKTVYYIEADADGKVTYKCKLGNNDNIKVCGLTAATTYAVSEDCQDYDPSWVASYVNTSGVSTNLATGSTKAMAARAMGERDNSFVMTNTRINTVPTGIAFDVLPFAIIGVIALAGVVSLVIVAKKRKVTE